MFQIRVTVNFLNVTKADHQKGTVNVPANGGIWGVRPPTAGTKREGMWSARRRPGSHTEGSTTRKRNKHKR